MSAPRDGHPAPPEGGRDATPAEVAAAISRPGRRYAVVSHHNPDGDAIGSQLGLARAMRAQGLDVVMVHPDPDPVPPELAFMLAPGEEIVPGRPGDDDRVLVAVDCASAMRLWLDGDPPHTGVAELVNIDHHHDNTRFGHLNLIEPRASSSAEVVVHVLEAAGWPVTADVAAPLYVGLLTDTGRFCYSNTGPEAHRVAALLIEAGADPHEIARLVYEEQPPERLLLLGRAVPRARVLGGGRLMLAELGPDDFAAAGGDDSEGIVEAMRAVRGITVAGLAREIRPGAWRVSLRSGDGAVDVSAIAREEGGGGHRAAAGFSTARPPAELFPWIESLVTAQLDGGA
jgi:phosphoesterase RecJ-like protein